MEQSKSWIQNRDTTRMQSQVKVHSSQELTQKVLQDLKIQILMKQDFNLDSQSFLLGVTTKLLKLTMITLQLFTAAPTLFLM